MKSWPRLAEAAWARSIARDTRLRREVAIKTMGPRFEAKSDAQERLLREARAVSALSHPNILALHDICSDRGSDFLVMELVRGSTEGVPGLVEG